MLEVQEEYYKHELLAFGCTRINLHEEPMNVGSLTWPARELVLRELLGDLAD